MRDTIGRYRITRKIGEGGMGVVYAARDERLGRSVAVKTLRDLGVDPLAWARFWREARVAASISHPNVCQLFEVGEENGLPFIVMELLEGQSLAARIAAGPMPLAEAADVAIAVLSALSAIHAAGLVHRDLKPSNVHLAPHGVKLLDFGLARPVETSDMTQMVLTQAGMVMGTPAYMAPEQIRGDSVDARSDLYGVGALLFEMLVGRMPFAGKTTVEMVHSVMFEQPPVLAGSLAVAAMDRIVRKAMAKRPEDRYQAAAAMTEDLGAAVAMADTSAPVHAVPATRLIVLPFRILRSDPETDFLAFSLADAITTSLSGLESLVVRSSLAAARFKDAPPDLRAIAAEAEVDIVLSGTLLRAGPQIRVTTQLVEVPGGRSIWSQTAQVPVGDVFQVQDDLTTRIVEALALPLTAREARLLRHDVPASAKAYDFFLRANELAQDATSWHRAVDLYRQCLDEDPRYAPAWARLGRVHRLLGKYGRGDEEELGHAEQALRRALEINPDLPLAHNLLAHLDVDHGKARDAMVRLLVQASRRATDPELFAGLTYACRYCGLLGASLAADDRARRLDSKIATSVVHTYWMLGQYGQVIAVGPANPVIYALALSTEARSAEAIETLRHQEASAPARLAGFMQATRTLLEDRKEAAVAALVGLTGSGFRDPEAYYYLALQFASLREVDRALALLERVVDDGFLCYPAFATDPWLAPLRGEPRLAALLARVEQSHLEAKREFVEAGGDQILGTTTT